MIANYHYLEMLLGPLNTMSREEIDRISLLNPDDSVAVKAVLNAFIKPYYEGLTEESQRAIKNSLQYFLTIEGTDFQSILDAQQESQLRSPSNPRNLFLWLWDVMFPNESYRISNLGDWKVESKYVGVQHKINNY